MKILYYAYVIFCFGNDGDFTPHVFWTILKLLLRLFIVLTTEKNSGKPDREVGKKNNLFEIYLSNSQFVCLLVCFVSGLGKTFLKNWSDFWDFNLKSAEITKKMPCCKRPLMCTYVIKNAAFGFTTWSCIT